MMRIEATNKNKKKIVTELLSNSKENELISSAKNLDLISFSDIPPTVICLSPENRNVLSDLYIISPNSNQQIEMFKNDISSLRNSLKDKDNEIMELIF